MAANVFDSISYHLKENHTFWEFYSPDSHWAGRHQTYIWTGTIARMLIDRKRIRAGKSIKSSSG